MSQSLQEVFDGFDLHVVGEVVKAEAADRPSGPWRSIDMQETVDVLASFNGGWEGKKKNDRPTLSEKSCGGQPNNFFFGPRVMIRLKEFKW